MQVLPILSNIIINLPKQAEQPAGCSMKEFFKNYGVFIGFILGFVATYFKNSIDNYYKRRNVFVIIKQTSARFKSFLYLHTYTPSDIKYDIDDCKAFLIMLDFLEKEILIWRSIRAIELLLRTTSAFKMILDKLQATPTGIGIKSQIFSQDDIKELEESKKVISMALESLKKIYKTSGFNV